MSSRSIRGLLLFLIINLTLSAMVLPRPPSHSLNRIHEDRALNKRKIYEGGKSVHGYLQNTNVERPDTRNNYRLLEIEVQGAEDAVDPSNLEGIVHTILKTQESNEHPANSSYPNPEVVPNSILGVRNVGISTNFRLDGYDSDEETGLLSNPRKVHDLDEKLYYLKNGKPKVYVNVRGNSGTFRKVEIGPRTTLSEGPLEYLRVTRPFERQTDWRSKYERKNGPPKKFDRFFHESDDRSDNFDDKSSTQNVETVGIRDRVWAYGEQLSTTENSMVTSSELPKQIPAPPSKVPSRLIMAQTTPVQRYSMKRSDVLSGYKVYED